MRGNSCCREKIGKEDAVLVRGFFHVRGQSPMGRQGAAVIDAPDNVGVADINDEEHRTYCTFQSGGLASRHSERLDGCELVLVSFVWLGSSANQTCRKHLKNCLHAYVLTWMMSATRNWMISGVSEPG